MALLPSGYIVATTGNSNFPKEKANGGVIVGITSATSVLTSPITRIFPLTLNAIDGIVRTVLVLPASGASHAYSAQKALAAGTFSFNQQQPMIKNVTTKINNIASTLLSINGMPYNRPHTLVSNKSKGAKTSTAHRSGYWRYLKISGQRTLWSTPPASNNVFYVLPTNNASNADDQTQFVTYKAIPGELVYMYGALNPIVKRYPAN
jgi:hypothetical protein